MNSFDVIVIGGSAGSYEALNAILPALNVDPPSPPVLVAIHVRADRPSGIAQLLATKCRVSVREAEDKEPLEPSTVYFAPSNYHLLVAKEGWLCLSVDPPVNFCRPSIDILFESAGAAFGTGVIGVLLSGANSDGAKGIASIHAAGGMTIVQDPRSAISPAMPAAARRECPASTTMRLEEIASFFKHLPRNVKV